jgi:hypothetical protein
MGSILHDTSAEVLELGICDLVESNQHLGSLKIW